MISGAKITLGSGDVPGAYEVLRSRVDLCFSPKTAHKDGFGDYTFFYCKDPEGNLVEIADVGDNRAVADAVRDHDAVIRSIRFLKIDYDNLIGGIKSSGVKRYLMVGGAGSLYLPGTTTTLIEAGRIPEQFLPEPTAGKAFLKRLKQEMELDWTFLSPSEMFSNDEVYGTKPGDRTGVFRVGLDELIVDENGISEISYEDFAVAMVDERESPKHSRRRFTVG